MSTAARAMADAAFADERLEPRTWSNSPGERYDEHSHEYHKVLFCISGSIVFHTPEGDISLRAGDRLDLPPNTAHSATVGDDGVTCMEAARQVG